MTWARERTIVAMTDGGEATLTALPHQLLGQTQTAVGTHDTQTSDVTMLDPIGRVFLHLCEHITHNLGRIIRGLGRT